MERLSTIYASALFDLAIEHNAVDEFLSQAKFLCETLNDLDIVRTLTHPKITAHQRREFFRNAFQDMIHADFLGFLCLVAEKNRQKYLHPALSKLISNIEQHKNLVKAKVLSATPYDEAQSESLRLMLSRKLRKTVELEIKVDPDLISGPYIFADGYHIDLTVKKRLHDLTVKLKEGCSA